MDEEQAVLDFFTKNENLHLGLSVAEQMDSIRENLNNRFWLELLRRIDGTIVIQNLKWQVALTEDRNSKDSLVGLHCIPPMEQSYYLRPMMEQQHLGGVWRIYFGLMWSSSPSPDQLRLPDICNLKASLLNAGFKSNEGFLGWQWTAFHPRRRDFLMRFARQQGELLDEAESILKTLLVDRRELLEEANSALRNTAVGLPAALNQLRSDLVD